MALTQVSSAGVKDGELVNADFHSAANIAKSKLENFVTNNADNRVITGSGTANTLNGEANLFFDGDKLGIGTTSPSRKLHVAASFIRVDDGYGLDTSGATEKVTLDNGFVSITTNSTERLRINSSGQVGIGTSNPVQQAGRGLHINGTDQTRIKLTNSTSGATANDGFDIIQESDMDINIVNHENMAMKFSTNATERARIAADGTIQLSSADSVIHSNSNSSRIRLFGGSSAGVNNGAALTLHGVSHSAGNYADLAAANGGHIRFRTGTNERMRITEPGQLLLNETSAFDSNVGAQFRYDNAGSQARFIFRNRGNNGSSRVRLVMSTLNRAANGDIFSGMEQYQSGGMAIFNGQSDTSHCNIGIFAGNWQPITLKNGNVSGGDAIHTRAYWGTSNGIQMEVGGPQSGTHKAIRFVTSHYGGERGFIGVTLGGTSYNSSSDYRLKQNIDGLTGAVARVKQLLPKRFQWKEDPTHTVDGFLAHEAAEVVPESVTGEKDGKEMQVMDNSKLVPLLTAALKEIVSRVEALEAA